MGEKKGDMNKVYLGGRRRVTTGEMDTYPNLQSELSEAPITAPSPPARPSLATDSGGQCLAGSSPHLLCLSLPAPQPPFLENSLILPHLPRLVWLHPVPLTPLEIFCLPCQTQGLSG